MSAYAKKSRFTELCPVCDRLCCETRDCISKGVKDDGIYCKYWQHSFAADLMFNLFEWKTHVESLEAERDALRERCEKLEWLREVEAWRPPATHCNNGKGSGTLWFNSCQEYSATLRDALAAAEVK